MSQLNLKEILISVVIPVYNVEDTLKKCVASLAVQTHSNLEIILIDDGSTDSSSALCDTLADNDSRIRVIHQFNQGLSAARNRGVKESHGSYIAFVDSDDYVEKTYLEKMLSQLIALDCDLAICGIYTNKIDWEHVLIPRYSSPVDGDELLENIINLGFENGMTLYVTAWNRLYKADICHQVLFPLNRIHEDAFTYYKFLHASKSVALIDKPLYHYIDNEYGIMHKKTVKSTFDFVDATVERLIFICKISRIFKKQTYIRAAHDATISIISAASDTSFPRDEYYNLRLKRAISSFKVALFMAKKDIPLLLFVTMRLIVALPLISGYSYKFLRLAKNLIVR